MTVLRAESQALQAEDEKWMRHALALAAKAAEQGEVPVGAVLVQGQQMISEAWNQPISSNDPTAHAEVAVLRQAGERLGNYRFPGATLYVTIEPCTMCVGAMIHARIDRLVFGAREPKAGAVVSQNQLLDHPAMNTNIRYAEGVLAEQCSQMISDFFVQRRQEKKQSRDLGPA